MAPHTRNEYITPRDLLLREATLLDYFNTWIEQAASLLSVTRLNYATSFCRWSIWAASLASLAHQIEAQSLYLSAMARTATKPMHGRRMSYSSATAICLRLFEESYESTTPILQLAVQRDMARRPALCHPPLPSSGSDLARHSWPHEHANTLQGRIYQQGY